MKFVKITIKKMNRFKKISYIENTFNRLYNDYNLRRKKNEKIKNYYYINESESYPYRPIFENKEFFPFSTRVMPSVYNFGKKYYNPNNNYFNKNYTERRNITDNCKNFEENKNNNNRYNNNMSNKKAIFSRINKDINENLFQYLTNTKLKNRPNIITPSNFSNQKNLFPHRNNKILINNRNMSKLKSNSKLKNDSKNINNDLIYCTTKSLNPSSLSGVEHLKTNYTNQQNINNIKSNNAILSNINSASSRINDLKMISGTGEYFYDFNSGRKRNFINNNNNMNNEQRDLSMQTISDSKIMELAGKYVNDEDNSSENYHMNNIIYNKKKYINKKNK